MTSPLSGHEIQLAGIDSAVALRAAATALPGHCLAGIFDACLRPIVYSRHHWLRYKGEYRVRADLRAALESLQSRTPRDWDDEEADLLLTLYVLDTANIGLDELRDRADCAAARDALLERHALYAAVAAPSETAPAALLDLALRVAQLRLIAQETHEPYSIIDGRAWYRTEGLIPRREIDTSRFTESVQRVMSTLSEAPSDASARELLVNATRSALARDGESAAVLRALMQAALDDPLLRADHVTITCPMGDMLDRPHEMTTSGAFFTETLLRDGIELGEYAGRLGHDSAEQLQRTIRARMLKLKRGAIRSLYGPGCMQGRFVEKHGGHMLFYNEDAHYRGHQSIGCASGGRASFALRFRRDDAEHELTPMVGDFRVVRMGQDECDLFDADGLRHTIRYGEWIRIVVEETYRSGAVLRLDDAPQPLPA